MPTGHQLDRHYTFDLDDIKYAKSLGIVLGIHIGKGVFSDVYEAKHCLNKIVLKVVYKELRRGKSIKEELNVAKILKAKTHKNIVQFLDTFENSDKTQTWFLMQWIEGQDMYKVLKLQKKPFDESVAKEYFRQLIEGLDFLHAIGIVHRDIKPHNILLCNETGHQNQTQSVVKYIDFGFAKRITIEDNKAICDSHKGSQIYMAPEVMASNTSSYDAIKSDIYSLAIVLYEMLFNCLPFATSDFGPDAEGRNELMLALKESLIIRYPEQMNVSDRAKELIESMICKESNQRISIEEIKSNDWFKD